MIDVVIVISMMAVGTISFISGYFILDTLESMHKYNADKLDNMHTEMYIIKNTLNTLIENSEENMRLKNGLLTEKEGIQKIIERIKEVFYTNIKK